VVGQAMVAFRDADFREGPVAALIGEQECGNPCRIGLESQRHHIEHDLNVILKPGRNAVRRGHGRVDRLAKPFGFLNALLDFADTHEVFVQFLLVAIGQLALKGMCFIEHEIQNRTLFELSPFQALDSFAVAAGPKQPLKQKARIRFGRDWRGG